MIARLPQLLCVLAAAAALAVAGCGGDDEPQGEKLPPEITKTLLQQLESVGDRVAAGVSGACDDIYSEDSSVGNIGPIDEALNSIPPDVDPEIRAACLFSAQPLFEELQAAGIAEARILPLSRTLVAFLHGFILMEIGNAFNLGGSIEEAFESSLETILREIG